MNTHFSKFAHAAFVLSALTALTSLGASACGSSTETSSSPPGGSARDPGGSGSGPGGGSGAVPTDRAYVSARVGLASGGTGGGSIRPASFLAGQNTGTALESLKYVITNIMICADMQTQGTGFNNPSDCLTIFRQSADEYSYDISPTSDWTGLANRARTSDDKFIDLMSASSRATLTTNTALTAMDVRAYNYGVITWALPIKFKATVATNEGTILYSHDGVTTRNVDHNNFVSYPTVTSESLSDGPAEEAIVLHPNGGTWFKFQAPLTITQADIDNRASYVLSLVFNPEALVKGWGYPGPTTLVESGESPKSMSIPMLDLTPVPHRESETVVKETYVATVGTAPLTYDLRLELYSTREAPSRTIYGASAATLVNSATAQVFGDAPKVFSIMTGADGKLAFQDWARQAFVSGFERKSQVGDTTAATLTCAAQMTPQASQVMLAGGCESGSLPLSFTLVGITEL